MFEARITSLSIEFIVVQHHNLGPEVIILIKKTITPLKFLKKMIASKLFVLTL